MRSVPETVLCLSHLRWQFVFQRPQHLLSRCAKSRRVVFFEEPMHDSNEAEVEINETTSGVITVVPHVPASYNPDLVEKVLKRMVDVVVEELDLGKPVLWYYTPMALGFTDHIEASAVVYDCMDELSLFKGAPPALTQRERRLFERADVVFTGGQSLYEHKRNQHHNIHPFPSSVDVNHFAHARDLVDDPPDQAAIPHPRVGYFGVVDERLNYDLLREMADARPDLQFVMIGPVVKVDFNDLPKRPNIHWLGGKQYTELPNYLAGWDVAMMPFALNDSTRFISPTKTPEYLAAGKPVVSTSIRDVVKPYGQQGLAWIADTSAEFLYAIDRARASDRGARVAHADAFLADLSWDKTWNGMWAHVERVLSADDVLPTENHAAGAGAMRHAVARKED